jgi:filamentous hemagglutinin family protein
MQNYLSKIFYFFNSVTVYSLLFSSPAKCQISVDNTTPTNVTQTDNVSEITGGTTAGGNLFHSFQEFSIPTGQEAFFNNATNINNIINRVTGGNISNIDGLIRANGSANLFLINPAGIIFGQNASLSIGGSFFGSTADSIIFPEGEFSATDLDNPPLITINAPIGLNFRDNPGSITNRSQASQDGAINGLTLFSEEGTPPIPAGLQTSPGQTLALIGGTINFEKGNVSAPGGRIELGSVEGNNIVNIIPLEQGFTLGYEEVTGFQNIQLSQFSLVDTTDVTGANSSGVIKIQGKQLNVLDASSIFSINLGEQPAGQLEIKTSEGVEIIGDSSSILTFSGNGSAGDINISTSNLTVKDGGAVASVPGTVASSGKLQINASNFVEVSGETSPSFLGIQAFDPTSVGNSQDLTITTNRLIIKDGSQVSSSTFGANQAGNLVIKASEIEISGTSQEQNPSGIGTQAGANSSGNAGDIIIETEKLTAIDGGVITASTFGSGDGGDLTINASESIILSGIKPTADLVRGSSGLFALADEFFSGEGGNLSVTTPQLTIEDGAKISAETFGTGDAGDATLNVDRLLVRNGGQVRASSLLGSDDSNLERGAGGTLTINARESVEIFGTGDINGEPVNSSLFTLAEGTGDAGNLTLTTNNLSVSDGGEINASATGSGAAGELKIKANNLALDMGTLTASTAAGEGGNIQLEIAENITLKNNSLISAEALGNADGGNLTIDTRFIIANPNQNSDILATAVGGKGGNIKITAESLLGIESRDSNSTTNDISASSQNNVDGTISIETPEVNSLRTNIEVEQDVVSPETIVSQGCYYEGEEAQNSFVVKGRGGMPPEPTQPFNIGVINVENNTSNTSDLQTNLPATEPTETKETQTKNNADNFVPARGIILKEDGTIILTAYPTPGTPGYRAYQQKIDCQPGDKS